MEVAREHSESVSSMDTMRWKDLYLLRWLQPHDSVSHLCSADWRERRAGPPLIE